MKILVFRKPKKWFKIWLSNRAWKKLEQTIIKEFLEEEIKPLLKVPYDRAILEISLKIQALEGEE